MICLSTNIDIYQRAAVNQIQANLLFSSEHALIALTVTKNQEP